MLWERFYLRWQRNWEKFDEAFEMLVGWKAKENDLRAKLAAKR